MEDCKHYTGLALAVVAAVVAYRYIPKAERNSHKCAQRLPNRREFLDHHLRKTVNEPTEDCIICRDAPDKPVRSELCGHIFCEECARNWFAARLENNRCPQCQMIVLAQGTGTSELLLSTTFTAAVFLATIINWQFVTCSAWQFHTMDWQRLLVAAKFISSISALTVGTHFGVDLMRTSGADWWRMLSMGGYTDGLCAVGMLLCGCHEAADMLHLLWVRSYIVPVLVVILVLLTDEELREHPWAWKDG